MRRGQQDRQGQAVRRDRQVRQGQAVRRDRQVHQEMMALDVCGEVGLALHLHLVAGEVMTQAEEELGFPLCSR